MADSPPRRFTLLDIMILTAATAAGLALGQAVGANAIWLQRPLAFLDAPPGSWIVRDVAFRVAKAWVPVIPFLAAGSLAAIALELRRPRPPLRQLAGQPGMVAAIIAVLTLVLHAAALFAAAWFDLRFSYATPARFQGVALNAALLLAHRIGWCVVTAWIALALSGRWPTPPSWPERLARLVGIGWVVSFLLTGYRVDQAVWWGDFVGQG